MKKIYVNEKWCLGCHLCEYYCAFANSGESDMVKALKGIEIQPRLRIEERGNVSFAVSCRHCDEPLCVKSCISGALTEENGVISIDPEKCVGCYTCIMACHCFRGESSMRYVIIGNSAAAVGTIEGIRQVDGAGSITVISDEAYHTYSRPLISYLLCGKTTEERMKYRPDDFYEKNRAALLLGRHVCAIRP